MMQEKHALVKFCPAQCQGTIASALVPRSEEEKTVMSKARDESKTSRKSWVQVQNLWEFELLKNAYFASV